MTEHPDRCRATFDTARCALTRGHYLPHHSTINGKTWTMPGEHHVSTYRGDAA